MPSAIGSRMSGGLAWASVDPSVNSTIEWITDCGCTITVIFSKGMSNSRCASMTSRPLLTSVAELIVTTGPMSQVGWASACSTVTLTISARSRPRNGPPLAVTTSRRTSSGEPPSRHWASAECSESTGTIWPGQIVPVDSEHSALAQCLLGGSPEEVRRLVVTASGGPFRGRERAEMVNVTVEQALAHPTWDMGPVVTINSATLVNKGLEVIEAHLLFDIPFEKITVMVHPQSVIHSMVEFTDGSTLAQASPPDMRLPISLALGWPDRVPGAAAAVDWTRAQSWTFEPLDAE